jgi:prepilin-type N-terminal cleavage/methylation domain-containing protein
MEKKLDKKQGGFTLIELIIAAAILVVAAIPLLQSFVVSSKVNMMGRRKEQAMTVAENICEGIKAVGPDSAYKWAEAVQDAGGADESAVATALKSDPGYSFSVIPSNSGMKVSNSKAEPDETPMPSSTQFKEFLKQYIPEDSIDGLVDSKKYSDYGIKKYSFEIDHILLGKTYYNAKVTMNQDLSDSENAAAVIIWNMMDKTNTYGTYNWDVMKFFNVTIEVSLENSDSVLAKYTGSVITKY